MMIEIMIVVALTSFLVGEIMLTVQFAVDIHEINEEIKACERYEKFNRIIAQTKLK